MSKRLLCIAGGLVLSFAGLAAAQDTPTQTTTTTTTTVQKAVQNPDGTYTIIDYPVGKEVTVNLTPTGTLTGATGTATVLRAADGSTIKLNLTGLPGDMSSINAYAISPNGRVTLLGPVNIANGIATQSFTSPLDKFMIVLSPEANLTSYGPDTNYVFRSAVPQGLAIVPYAQSGPKDGAPIGDRVAATTTAGATSSYNVPMLGIPNYRRGTDTHLRVHFPTLADSRANIFLEPRKDGPTQIKLRFHSLKRVPANTRLVLWAVGPDNTFVRLGQVINTGNRNEAQIQSETNLKDFGLLVTMENADAPPSPGGQIYATIENQ